jgi:hypothetical protein
VNEPPKTRYGSVKGGSKGTEKQTTSHQEEMAKRVLREEITFPREVTFRRDYFPLERLLLEEITSLGEVTFKRDYFP